MSTIAALAARPTSAQLRRHIGQPLSPCVLCSSPIFNVFRSGKLACAACSSGELNNLATMHPEIVRSVAYRLTCQQTTAGVIGRLLDTSTSQQKPNRLPPRPTTDPFAECPACGSFHIKQWGGQYACRIECYDCEHGRAMRQLCGAGHPPIYSQKPPREICGRPYWEKA